MQLELQRKEITQHRPAQVVIDESGGDIDTSLLLFQSGVRRRWHATFLRLFVAGGSRRAGAARRHQRLIGCIDRQAFVPAEAFAGRRLRL